MNPLKRTVRSSAGAVTAMLCDPAGRWAMSARGRALVAYLLARRQVPIAGYGGAR